MDFTMAILTHPIQVLLMAMLVVQIARRALSGLNRAMIGRSTPKEDPAGVPATSPLQVLTTLLCGYALVGGVWAAEPPRPAAGNLPPRYPASQVETMKTDTLVTLQVVVDHDGSVRDSKIVAGAEPFASAALHAVKRWRYEPARDGDRAIAMPWEIRVRFQPPPKASDRWRTYRRIPSLVRVAATTPAAEAR